MNHSLVLEIRDGRIVGGWSNLAQMHAEVFDHDAACGYPLQIEFMPSLAEKLARAEERS